MKISPSTLRALATGALLFAAAPTVALAAPASAHPRSKRIRLTPGGPCKISLAAEPSRVTAGDEKPQLFGRLTCPSNPEPSGITVTLMGHVPGQPATQIATGTTTTGGYYSIEAPAPTESTIYYVTADGAKSTQKVVHVSPQVTLTGPSESKALFTGVRNRVTFTGTVGTLYAGAEVVLQREDAISNEEWHPIQRGVVAANGTYTLVHVFGIPGDANIRVVVRPLRPYGVFGASSPLSYVITQRENAALTLVALSPGGTTFVDPISYGQTIDLKGTLAGAKDTPVTLYARHHLGAFAAIATTTTGPSGEYSFTQEPQEDTGYKVVGGGHSSAVLFEGVKAVVTANAPSSTTVEAGTTVTFTGTVLPYRPGHFVYLERQNMAGAGPNTAAGGYHVVAVGTESPPTVAGGPGTFSVSRTLFGAGKQVYRVKIPGDPLNGSASSASFTLEVTPAPAPLLHPAPPTKLPGEGVF